MLILARHGNTFAPKERAVYVGARQDPALVEAGRAQADALGATIAPMALRARRILASPMGRTQEHARRVAQRCGAQTVVEIEPALKEIDYGAFAGRHKEDLEAEGYGPGLRSWESFGLYPAGAGFSPPRQEVLEILRAWLAAMGEDAHAHPGTFALAVTHGGILRLLSTLLPQPSAAMAKMSMACGRVAVVTLERTRPAVRAWDVAPGPTLTKLLELL